MSEGVYQLHVPAKERLSVNRLFDTSLRALATWMVQVSVLLPGISPCATLGYRPNGVDDCLRPVYFDWPELHGEFGAAS